MSRSEGREEGVKGASPAPGTVSSMNCPVSKAMGSAGLSLRVLMVGVSANTSRTSARIGRYGLGLLYILHVPLQDLPNVDLGRAGQDAAPAAGAGVDPQQRREEI